MSRLFIAAMLGMAASQHREIRVERRGLYVGPDPEVQAEIALERLRLERGAAILRESGQPRWGCPICGDDAAGRYCTGKGHHKRRRWLSADEVEAIAATSSTTEQD